MAMYFSAFQTKVEDSKQIEEICSFLSEIVLQQEFEEQKTTSEGSGGLGAYSLINYSVLYFGR
jgi:hypothetical protein